jgi:hypothetical protein
MEGDGVGQSSAVVQALPVGDAHDNSVTMKRSTGGQLTGGFGGRGLLDMKKE